MSDAAWEDFDCAECGLHIFRLGGVYVVPLCAECLSFPGWFSIPEVAGLLHPPFGAYLSITRLPAGRHDRGWRKA